MRRFADREGLELHGVGRRDTVFKNYTKIDLSKPFDLPFKPDVIIHCAARASPWGTRKEFIKQNVDATAEVIRFSEKNGNPKIIYLSSSSVFYRHENQIGLKEESPIGPNFVNDYAETKFMGEELVRNYSGDWAILRPRAVFGPGDTVLFPRILIAAAKGQLPLFVSDGPSAIGDLIYIDSLCDYILSAAIRPEIKGCYNLTNNHPVEIQEFLLKTFDQLGIPRPTRRVKISTAMLVAAVTESLYRIFRLNGEPPITRFGVSVFAYSKTFDVSHTLKHLGYPSVTIEEGMERFIKWQKAQ